MLKRWIIRSLCIALLTLCATVWVGSYWQALHLARAINGRVLCLSISTGVICIFRTDSTGGWTDGWLSYMASPNKREVDWTSDCYGRARYRLAGFAIDPLLSPVAEGLGLWLTIPLWFPTTLSAGLLWLVWRKTRPKYTGKGFPVEANVTKDVAK
jgi:hypothetical protein